MYAFLIRFFFIHHLHHFLISSAIQRLMRKIFSSTDTHIFSRNNALCHIPRTYFLSCTVKNPSSIYELLEYVWMVNWNMILLMLKSHRVLFYIIKVLLLLLNLPQRHGTCEQSIIKFLYVGAKSSIDSKIIIWYLVMKGVKLTWWIVIACFRLCITKDQNFLNEVYKFLGILCTSNYNFRLSVDSSSGWHKRIREILEFSKFR